MLLLEHAKVTGRAGEPAAEAIAIERGRIAAVGPRDEVPPVAGEGARAIDLGGRRVIPGLIDSHAHVVRAGLRWEREVRWDGVRSLEEGLARIRRRAAELPSGAWIAVVGGWHPRQLREGRGPTRAELDRAAPDHPCYVQRLYVDAVLNSTGLARCGFTAGAADPEGGELERDANGELTGVIRGAGAFARCLRAIGPSTVGEQTVAIRMMLRDLGRFGLTGALDPGGIGVTPETYAAFYEVWRRGELTLRLRLFLGAGERGAERRQLEDWMRYLPRGFGDDRLRITGLGEIILFACWDGDGLHPIEIDRDALREFTELSLRAAEGGWPMHVHAIRDESAGAILDCWEEVARARPLGPLRFSIAHAEAIGERNLARARALGLGLALQDRLVLRAADSAQAWGAEAAAAAPPLRRMLELGFPLGAGTDSTVASSIDPWRSLWWLVTGKNLDGGPTRAPEHRLSRAHALDLYTHGSAWFSFEEGSRGRIAPGYLADLAVLSDDYFAVDEDAIPDLRAELTLVGGEVAYASEAFRGVEEAVRAAEG